MATTDTVPARFMDLRERSSDWKLDCTVHGAVTMILVFNEDIANRSFCQQCFEDGMAKLSKKVTFNANGGPMPAARVG